ncbi:T6SS immunity protein Tdi1 domain-containing protein [Cellulomonas xiejunii]|uniref:DUF1851 domain-containing protein n=1 Tax=Cellulomonas xiejunii TaxID=2968083 RepID=A0ABY5KMK1_9CELL|nr:T6SS immunity protein Tdi1 domain-containing protein [Cellulomonas xiejunii]MCC2313680.1 DUF1851 domain-containing protein [Cellulomonas xiejunii]MCC2321108.1 DUF1851 domain-containing protein [Cellulomonas xiejunii]UUI71701.1 DUF1851 domain-containing protein [Cellulomonas xiejunii]
MMEVTVVLDRFLAAFPRDDAGVTEPVSRRPELVAVRGYGEAAEAVGSGSRGGGRFRLLSERTWTEATGVLVRAFPGDVGRAIPFGRDWMGRIYAIDVSRTVDGDPQITLLEVNQARSFQVDHSLTSFLDEGLVDEPDLYLEQEVYDAWVAGGGALPGPDECVGFVVPSFLGGDFATTNLEVTDLSVYWEVTAQLVEASRTLRPGTGISGVSID